MSYCLKTYIRVTAAYCQQLTTACLKFQEEEGFTSETRVCC